MGCKKLRIHLRIRQDRADLMKEMNDELNRRALASGGKAISFNSFVEDIMERFIYSKRGQELCELVDSKREVVSNGWKDKKRKKAKEVDESEY
jgi:hypothetical protein